jgi:hypothetical protein
MMKNTFKKEALGESPLTILSDNLKYKNIN